MNLDSKRALRLRVMEAVYDATGGARTEYVAAESVARDLGVTIEELGAAADFLEGEGLLSEVGLQLSLTHQGAVEFERSLLDPNEKTDYFPPYNYIHVTTMVNSSIVQASAASHQQNVTVGAADRDALADLVDRFLAEGVLDDAGLDEDDLDELTIELQTAQVQLSAKTPRLEKVQASLARVAEISTAAAKTADGVSKLADYATEIHELLPGL